MNNILVVLRAEDAVVDFLSVLAPTGTATTHVLLCDTGEALEFAPGTGTAERLAALAARVRLADESVASPGPDALAAHLRQLGGGNGTMVWTHSAADTRRSRGRVGRDVGLAAEELGLSVRHAVGYSPFLQFVSDLDRPLDRQGCADKLRFVNDHCAHLLDTESPQHMLHTGRVPSTERFFASGGAEERERLYALMASLDDEAAAVSDPWEFATSAYEQRRLDATTAWIARSVSPDNGTLVEVGACEGALTTRLVDKGFRVAATEPNPVFRERLHRHLGAGSPQLDLYDHSLEQLAGAEAGAGVGAEQRGVPGSAYLLIEMLYYGQDLDLLDALPGDLVLVALEPEALDTRLRPWLDKSAQWSAVDETVLVRPALEGVCGGRAYLRKRGSTGVVLRRATR
ncbi:SAM-dependent methyltransferase [Streptomyces sp. NPDC059009]|uniref:SAM-dependent methyltransferase n=1 Tax=Streptomyces sp. NPDC059009 TaxID=3346694 RepID=UPI0036CBA258